MKTEPVIFTLRRLTCLAALVLTSCALPPRQAMRVIQRDGLIPYLTGDYGVYQASPAYAASAAPFQTGRRYVEPRPVYPIPYRTTYHTNRYMKSEYRGVPYRSRSVTSSSRSSKESKPSGRAASSLESSSTQAPDRSAAVVQSPADTTAPAAPKPVESLPYGTPVVGRPGMVTSPYAQKQQLVDVTGMAPGDTVKDPYTGKLFKVPPTQQADATSTASSIPAVSEAPTVPVPTPAEPSTPKP